MDLEGCQEIQGEGWSVWVCGVKQTADPGPAIWWHIFGEALQETLNSKDVSQRISSGRSIGMRSMRWHQKCHHSSNFEWQSMSADVLILGRKWRCGDFWTMMCPSCKSMTKDKVYLMSCLNQYCKEIWVANVMIVEEWMEQQDTMLEIQECMVWALRARLATWDFCTECSEQASGW